MSCEIIKKAVNFGLKTKIDVNIAELALKYREGDILDIGCGTCQPKPFNYLQSEGWKEKQCRLKN